MLHIPTNDLPAGKSAWLKMTRRPLSEWSMRLGRQVALFRKRTGEERIYSLPLTSDITKFSDHLKTRMTECMKALEESTPDSVKSDWRDLAEVLLVYLIVFNRRRVTETSQMTLEDVQRMQERGPQPMDEELVTHPLEKAMLSIFRRVVVRGKYDNLVPVLFAPLSYKALQVLLKHRSRAGIASNNPYVFALTNKGSREHIRGDIALWLLAQACPELQNPAALYSGRLRKHVATHAQALSVSASEKTELCRMMGHGDKVHFWFYEHVSHAQQTGRFSRFLLALEQGSIQVQRGSTLTDLQFDWDSELLRGRPLIAETDGTMEEDLGSDEECVPSVSGGSSLAKQSHSAAVPLDFERSSDSSANSGTAAGGSSLAKQSQDAAMPQDFERSTDSSANSGADSVLPLSTRKEPEKAHAGGKIKKKGGSSLATKTLNAAVPLDFERSKDSSANSGAAAALPMSTTKEVEKVHAQKKMKKEAVSLGQKELESPADGQTTELTPAELLGPSVNVEELQRRISESFSRKLAEWERRKYRRPTSPEMEHKSTRRKEKDDSRVRKKTREEKEKERQEKAREREMQRVEKEQVKLEKEKVRIEKERIRALERQAKLERMKGRLSQPDSESAPPSSSPAPGLLLAPSGTAHDPRVAAQFQRKLEELEAMKDGVVAAAAEASSSGSPPKTSSSPPQPNGQQRPPPLTLQPCADSPEERSPVDRTSDLSLGDDNTSITEENLTKTNIASLERANNQLLEEVQKKEHEYNALQEEVNRLNTQLAKVRQEHATEMARFRRELETGEVSGPVQVDVSELEQTMRDLEERIIMMEDAGDQLAESMESAAIGKWQSIEGEEAVSGQLVDMIEQMKGMLVQASQSRESADTLAALQAATAAATAAAAGQEKQAEKSMALHNFEQVYSHAMKLQVQMNNLRVSQLERNKEIMLIKRQLLLQEVNNVLLQAHITRRETELYQYREAKRQANVRRWNTFSSSDTTGRVPLAQGDSRPPFLRNASLQESDQPPQPPGAKQGGKHDDIPYITEDVGIPEAGVGPAAVSAETTTATTTPATAAKAREHSTDHVEQHLVSPIAESTTMEEKSGPAAGATVADGAGPFQGPATSATVAAGPSIVAQVPGKTGESPAVDGTKEKTSAPVPSKVETGSPTLLTQVAAKGLASGPADMATGPTDAARPPEEPTRTETPDLPIPKGPDLSEERTSELGPSAPQGDDKYDSPTEPVIVTECTKSAIEGPPGSPAAALGGVDISSREQTQQPQPSKPVRSPVSRQKYLRRQREEREKHKEKKLASPTSPHKDVASGKPPLPRTPHSPNTSQRSKSVGDMDGMEPNGATADQPLKGVIERFEKRATVCETEERKIEFRKTPSPTLHLPRVGLVSRVRRLKPAAELLQESQRYRSGHSIYATRIMNRYLPAQSRSGTGTPTSSAPSAASAPDKENISGTSYVQAIVKRLSRESTPVKSGGSSSTNSSLSLHRTDSPRAHSEFVAHLVHKLSSSSGPETTHKPSSSHSPSMPLKDLTNDGQVKKMTQVFSEDQASSGQDVGAPGRSGVVGGASPSRQRAVLGASAQPDVKPDSTISPSHVSMPALSSESPASAGDSDGGAEAGRERAATYCTSEAQRPRQQPQRAAAEGGGSIEQLSSEDLLDPAALEGEGHKISPSSSTKSKNVLCCQSSTCNRSKSNNHKAETSGSSRLPSSPKSQERRSSGRGEKSSERMETIGVLCKQSMSFDLGVSLRAQSPELAFRGPMVGAEASTSQGAKARPSSTSSEGETTSSEERKKSRRFLDSSWLQKPKKFFKVSK